MQVRQTRVVHVVLSSTCKDVCAPKLLAVLNAWSHISVPVFDIFVFAAQLTGRRFTRPTYAERRTNLVVEFQPQGYFLFHCNISF